MMSSFLVKKVGGLNAAILATASKRALGIGDVAPISYQIVDDMVVVDSNFAADDVSTVFHCRGRHSHCYTQHHQAE